MTTPSIRPDAPPEETSLSRKDYRLSLTAVISCTAIAGVGLGITLPLLAVAIERMGVSSTLLGLNTAMPALASLIFVPIIPYLLRFIPAVPFLLTCICVSTVCMITYPLFPDIGSWFIIRFINGVAIAGLFMVSETWINELARETHRGRMIGLYAAILSGGFALGPILLLIVGYDGIAPYVTISALIALGAIPLVMARHLAPNLVQRPNRNMLSIITLAPTAILGALMYGALEAEMLSLMTVYGLRVGLPLDLSTLVLTIFGAGNIACQIPIGMLADRIDRRLLLLLCAGVSFLGALSLPFVITNPWIFVPTFFIFGGVVTGLYTVGLILVGQRFKGSNLALANAAYILLYSVGSLAGPVLGGVFMDIWDPHGLAVSMVLLTGIYILLAGYRYFSSPTQKI
ncbi:MAG: MFS transporter [Parvularculales bacterium]